MLAWLVKVKSRSWIHRSNLMSPCRFLPFNSLFLKQVVLSFSKLHLISLTYFNLLMLMLVTEFHTVSVIQLFRHSHIILRATLNIYLSYRTNDCNIRTVATSAVCITFRIEHYCRRNIGQSHWVKLVYQVPYCASWIFLFIRTSSFNCGV